MQLSQGSTLPIKFKRDKPQTATLDDGNFGHLATRRYNWVYVCVCVFVLKQCQKRVH